MIFRVKILLSIVLLLLFVVKPAGRGEITPSGLA
jgi:hypothetical protein